MSERPPEPDRRMDPLQVFAEADEQTRAVIERELQRDADLNARGLRYGLVVTLAFLAACVFLIASGHDTEGTILGVMFIAALAAILVVGRRR